MDKNQAEQALKLVKESSQKRNFKQSYDLIFNLKNINLKDPTQAVNFYQALHYSRGKKIRIAALVGPELISQAKQSCDVAVALDDFSKYTKKSDIKKLADSADYFIAQATIMPKIAAAFGRVFGPRGKMPDPKAGCVVPPNANLKALYERLQNTLRVRTKNDPIVHVSVGNEGMPDNEVVDNILAVYNGLIHHLPNESHNIKSSYLKLTMGKPIRIGEAAQPEEDTKKKSNKKPVKSETTEEASQEEKTQAPKAEKKEKPKAEKKTAKKQEKKEASKEEAKSE